MLVDVLNMIRHQFSPQLHAAQVVGKISPKRCLMFGIVIKSNVQNKGKNDVTQPYLVQSNHPWKKAS